MAGHSKWKNIRIRKGKQDAIKGKQFTKISREIIVAARAGGGDPGMNARLRVAVEKARAVSMPVDNIKRAIQRGTGEIEGADFEELTYEGRGPGGAAIIIECYSENKNRTVADLRHSFTKSGGSLGESGSVSWQFKHVGEIEVAAAGMSEDDLTMAALDAGADDVVSEDETFRVYTAVESLHAVNDGLNKAGIKTSGVGLTYVATTKTEPTSDDIAKLLRLLDTLEELDDVQETYVNVDITEDMLQEA
jgi:YebC/PmpR family DNA-binding regulatory protein